MESNQGEHLSRHAICSAGNRRMLPIDPHLSRGEKSVLNLLGVVIFRVRTAPLP